MLLITFGGTMYEDSEVNSNIDVWAQFDAIVPPVCLYFVWVEGMEDFVTVRLCYF